MFETVLLTASGWLVLTLVGLCVFAPMRRYRREVWLPAAPVAGAALVVVVGHAALLVFNAAATAAVVGAIAVGLLLWGIVARRRPWQYSLRSVLLLAVSNAIGAAGACIVLIPNFRNHDSAVVHPGSTLDAYFYVSESSWLSNTGLFPAPDPGALPAAGVASPAYWPAKVAIDTPLRMGQAMVQSVLDAILGKGAIDTFCPFLALYVILIAGAVLTAGRLLRMPEPAAMAAVSVSVVASTLVYQSWESNADSILGLSFAIVTIGAIIGCTFRRASIPLAALFLAALVGTYTELGVFVGPTVILGVLIRSRKGYWSACLRAFKALGLAVVIAPYAWYRGVLTLLAARGGQDLPSAFIEDGKKTALARILGTSPVAGHLTSGIRHVTLGTSFWLILGFVAVGLFMALGFDRSRGAWFGLLGVGGGYVAWLTLTNQGYVQSRSVVIFTSLMIFAVFQGWGAASVAARRRRIAVGLGVVGSNAGGLVRLREHRWVELSLVTLSVMGALWWSLVNIRTDFLSLNNERIAQWHVDESSLNTVASWVDEVGGEGGRDVTAISPDLFNQLWLEYGLRDYSQVAYPQQWNAYLSPLHYWGGEVDPYLILGPGTLTDIPASAVLATSGNYSLVETGSQPLTVAFPWNLSWATAEAENGEQMLAAPGAQLGVLNTDCQAESLTLTMAAKEPVDVTVAVEGSSVSQRVLVDSSPVEVHVDTPAACFSVIDMNGSVPNQPNTVFEVTSMTATPITTTPSD